KWCSTPLAGADYIRPVSAPAIAALDHMPAPTRRQIVIDNKVFDGNGLLRYSGGSGPRSRTAIVANLIGGTALPQVITGSAAYQSSPLAGPLWTGAYGWNTAVTNGALVYPAVAEVVPLSPG